MTEGFLEFYEAPRDHVSPLVRVVEAAPVAELLERLIASQPQQRGYDPTDHDWEDALALLGILRG